MIHHKNLINNIITVLNLPWGKFTIKVGHFPKNGEEELLLKKELPSLLKSKLVYTGTIIKHPPTFGGFCHSGWHVTIEKVISSIRENIEHYYKNK